MRHQAYAQCCHKVIIRLVEILLNQTTFPVYQVKCLNPLNGLVLINSLSGWNTILKPSQNYNDIQRLNLLHMLGAVDGFRGSPLFYACKKGAWLSIKQLFALGATCSLCVSKEGEMINPFLAIMRSSNTSLKEKHAFIMTLLFNTDIKISAEEVYAMCFEHEDSHQETGCGLCRKEWCL